MYREQKFKVGLVQMAMSADVDENLRRAGEFVEEAAGKGAEIICLPEMFRSQYFCQREDVDLFDLAEPLEGVSFQHLSKIAKDEKVTVIAPIFERRSAVGVFHNSLVVIGENGENVGVYRKMHIPDDPAYYEKFYFTPGDLGFKAFETTKAKIGTLICWDQWYPEGARLTALRGAQILFYPTAIGWQPPEKEEYGERQHASWETIQRAHAIANGVYVAVANRVGHEPTPAGHPGEGIEFWGQSFIADPSGQILTKGSVSEEQILLAEVDYRKLDVQRTHWPFLRDRRIDAYQDITKRFID